MHCIHSCQNVGHSKRNRSNTCAICKINHFTHHEMHCKGSVLGTMAPVSGGGGDSPQNNVGI